MTYNIIATGSSGNAVLINDEILIDIGVPWAKLKPYAKQIKLVLLTHVHGDHFKPATVRALHRERPAVRFGCCEWMVEPLVDAGVSKRVIDVVSTNSNDPALMYKGIAIVQPWPTPHNVPNCAWTISIQTGENWEDIFYATDLATLDGIEAKNYTMYFLEANHSRAEIEARIAAKHAAGEFAYEEAAARNHMSREQAEDWLARNAGPNSKYILLHQHREKETGDGT